MFFSKFLDPKNDFAFKKIFGAEKNKDILIGFLNDILKCQDDSLIKEVTFLKPSQDPEYAFKKQSIIDILCQDNLGRQIIVEIQVARAPGFEKRAQYYAARAYSSQMGEGEQYQNLKEIIFLAITDFIMFPNKEDYLCNHVILDKKSYEHDLKDFSFTFLELPKFNKTIEQLSTPIERWAYFFKYASRTKEEDLDQLIGQLPTIKRAYEELNQFSWNDDERMIYERERKRIMDNTAIEQAALAEKNAAINAALEQGLEQGKAEGLAEGVNKVALNLLNLKWSLEQVSQVTGLSISRLEKLKNTVSTMF